MSNTELKLDVTFEQVKPLSVDFGAVTEVPPSKEIALIDRSITEIEFNGTTVGDYAFASCTALTSISFPNATSLGDYAFYGCKGLSSIEATDFPEVTSIGEFCFYNCSDPWSATGGLTSISFPKCTTIGASAFSRCSELTSANLPEVITIGNYAFESTRLPEITSTLFPKLTSIGRAAFQNNISLTTVSLSTDFTLFDIYAFSGCTNLTSVTLSNFTGKLGQDAFSSCTKLATVSIPKVIGVGSRCFSKCTSLSMLDILGGDAINSYAFMDSSIFNTLIMRSDTMTTLDSTNAFNGTKFAENADGGTIYVPQALIASYTADSVWGMIINRPNNQILSIEGSIYEED